MIYSSYSAYDLPFIFTVNELYSSYLHCRRFMIQIESAGSLRLIFTVQDIYGLY